MSYCVSPELHYCTIEASSIFLDLARDRYFILQQTAHERFQRFLTGCADAADCDWLLSRQIVCPDDHQRIGTRQKTCVPSRSLLERALPEASHLSTLKAITAQIRASRQLKRQPLARVLSQVERHGRERRTSDHRRVLRVAAAFHRARRYVSGIDKCLVRSVAMKHVLAREDCLVDLVIGVSLPFSAHAWIQWESDVLTDPLDLVSNYTPILVA